MSRRTSRDAGRALFWLPILASAFALASADADVTEIDLADVVGGGDGSGTGSNAGVDITDGSTTTTQTGPIMAPTNTFVAADNPLVDGVVVPDGGPGGATPVPISSTGITVTGISDSTEPATHTWDHVWNGVNFGTSTTWSGSGPLLGVHANKGVTFDLQAIGAAHGGLVPRFFDAIPTTGSSPSAQVDFYAYEDGVLVASASIAGADDLAGGFDSALSREARFLTLVTSSDGPISGDWSTFLSPVVEMVPPLTVGQMDGFDVDRDGWARGQRLVESGDGYLRIPGPEGIYMTTFHLNEHWAGDYPGAGVTAIRVDLRNEGPEPLTIYLAFGTTAAPSQGGEWLATATPVSLPPGSGWGTYDIPIEAGDLVAVQGAATYASVMPNVLALRIVHNDMPDPRGLVIDADLNIDNIEALPEPSAAASLGAGVLLLLVLDRLRRRRSAKARR